MGEGKQHVVCSMQQRQAQRRTQGRLLDGTGRRGGSGAGVAGAGGAVRVLDGEGRGAAAVIKWAAPVGPGCR
jgi:hypothetical protein